MTSRGPRKVIRLCAKQACRDLSSGRPWELSGGETARGGRATQKVFALSESGDVAKGVVFVWNKHMLLFFNGIATKKGMSCGPTLFFILWAAGEHVSFFCLG